MRFKLVKKQQETPTIYSFILKPHQQLKFQAGQFIQVTVPHQHPDSRGISRYFSLASSPNEELILVATRITADSSSFKKALLTLSEGTELELFGPYGKFVLPEDIKDVHCIFITGGIGVTPVRSILKYVVDQKLTLPITLLYSNTTPEEIAFYDFFNELAQQNPSLDIVYTITKPEAVPAGRQDAKTPWNGRVGRIDENLIKEHLKNGLTNLFYISGPPQMVGAMLELVKTIGTPDQNIKRELFTGY